MKKFYKLARRDHVYHDLQNNLKIKKKSLKLEKGTTISDKL